MTHESVIGTMSIFPRNGLFQEKITSPTLMSLNFHLHAIHRGIVFFFLNVWFQKISILPPQKGLEIPGRRGGLKDPKLEEMYEAKLEFLEGRRGGGWGVIGQIPCVGLGYGYFLEPHRNIIQHCHNSSQIRPLFLLLEMLQC